MKSVIVYASKTGTTKKCAQELANRLGKIEIYDIEEEEKDISSYDLVIIGSSIRIGMFHPKMKHWIEQNKQKLLEKEVAYFICCGFSENTQQYLENNIPKDLLEKAILMQSFGGELNLEQQKGIDKFIVKLVTKNRDSTKKVEIEMDKIEEFANTILRKINN